MVSNAWVLSPTKVNEFRFGYTTLYNAVEQLLSGKTNVVANLGLPFPTEAPQSWGVPNVGLEDLGLSGWGDSTNGPFVINDSIRQFVDNFSWNHGKHSIRFGGEYRYDIYNQFGNQYTRSEIQYNGQYTANPTNLAGGNAAADYDLGDPYRIDLALQVASSNDTANSFALYIDDTYKMSSKLTVTLGLRWEVEQPWLDTQQNMTNFYLPNGANLPQQANVNPSQYPILVRAGTNNNFYQGLDYIYENLTGLGTLLGTPVAVARNGILGPRMVNTDWHDFAPRFGIAYSPTPKWSIRTGFGVFYSLGSMNNRFDTNRATA
jgi:outer membrane receptor protein involved in Fe transport